MDVTRAHFDYDFNYLSVPEDDCQRVFGDLVKVIPESRSRGLLVIFVKIGHKISPLAGETMSLTSPFWRYQVEDKISIGDRVRRPINIENSPVMEIMPQLGAEEQDIIVHKQRYSALMSTLLEMYLRIMSINTLFFTGINTDNCILCTAFGAYNRDCRVIVVEDYYASMNGKVYRGLAIMQIKASLGWVVNSDSVADTFDGRTRL